MSRSKKTKNSPNKKTPDYNRASESLAKSKRSVTSRKTERVKSERRKDYNRLALQLHKELQGKIEIKAKGKLKTKTDWSTMYSPGVGAVSEYLAARPQDARRYTTVRNSVAVVSDGSAILGLGNLGPVAALPVMEGKCAIFKALADVDAWPIVLNTQEPEEIIAAVKAIAPGFGGINLEDIAAPKCFEIEERLKSELNIPVMHDDQHGTAIVTLAGLINAAKVVKKKLADMKVVVVGAGAAGRAVTLLLLEAGVKHIVVTDSKGAIVEGRRSMSAYKQELVKVTNPEKLSGDVSTVVVGADVIIGVSGPGTVTAEHVELMAKDAIVFALANPTPEIMPDVAKQAGAAIVATGRSDMPNQINNSLAFPGIFRGTLDRGVSAITDEMKVRAAQNIAKLVPKPTAHNIVPTNNTPGLVEAVAKAIK